ncbi:MAG: GIY-YIG nuclease family protein [bacterium]
MSQMIDRKTRIREYKETPRPAGIYRVRNIKTGRSLIGSTANLPGMLNRQRFQLENGAHPDKDLQRDWDELGPDAFEFEVLDRLEPRDEPACDPTEDLRALKEMWIEKLTASGESLYRQSLRGT